MSSSGNKEGDSGRAGRVESMKLLSRNDDKLTLLFQRRHFVVKPNAESESSDTGTEKDTVTDPETQKVIDNVRMLNKKIRAMGFGKTENSESSVTSSSGSSKSSKSSKSTKSSSSKSSKSSRSSSKTSSSSSSRTAEIYGHPKWTSWNKAIGTDSESNDSDDSVKSARIKLVKPEPCDHRGVPLSHPMAITPYPGASTAAQRAKARLMLKEIAIRCRQEQEDKERAVAMGKALEKYEKKTSSAEKTSRSSSRCSRSNRSSTKSSSVKSSRSSRSCKSSKCSKTSKTSKTARRRCESCGSCRKCAEKCFDRHYKISDKEREKFYRDIRRLRKKLITPECSRENASKSPYDVTQSSSDVNISDKEEEKEEKKEEEKEEEQREEKKKKREKK